MKNTSTKNITLSPEAHLTTKKLMLTCSTIKDVREKLRLTYTAKETALLIKTHRAIKKGHNA